MSAIVTIAETNGPDATSTEDPDVDNVNFGSDDSPALVPADYPITAQVDGHSFEKWLRLYVTDFGGNSQIDNVKVWLSDLGGGWLTDEGMSCNLRTSGYVQASYPVAGPVEIDSPDADLAMPETEPSGANVGIEGTLGGTISTVPSYTDFFVLQLDVSASTPAGLMNTKTLTFQWDEQ